MLTVEQQKELDELIKEIHKGDLIEIENLSKTLWRLINSTSTYDEPHSLEKANEMLTLFNLIKKATSNFNVKFTEYYEQVFDMDK